jgi:NAD(P)H-hydrate epimerase
MQALLQSEKKLRLDSALLEECQAYAEKNQATLVLKGAPTFIFHPGEPILVNPTGDPGMATAGSGDVLTGILASLLSQGLDCRSAAILGVYLHGVSGESAAQQRGGSRGMIASDLIGHLADAFHALNRH